MRPRWKYWFRPMPAGEGHVVAASEPKEPSLAEVLLMFAVVFGGHLLMVCRATNFWDVADSWGDNSDYLRISTAIRQWHFSGAESTWHFWGFPYAIAGISRLLSIPQPKALVLVSMLAALAVSVLVHRLYGGWVAAAFLFFINYQWILTSVEGGSESLFTCLLCAAFLATRAGRWKLAIVLASLATTVRPVGAIALLAFAAVLAWRKSYRQLAVITLISLAIGVLYIVPVWIIQGSPFANITGYRSLNEGWGAHQWPITYPFGALIPDYLDGLRVMRWPNFPFPVVWLVIALAAITVMWLPRNRSKFSPMIQPEFLFASIYTLFLVLFNGRGYIAFSLHRYLIPVLPIFLFSLRDWIPRQRWLLWCGAVLSAPLSAAAVVGFKNVFGFRLP